MKIKAVIFDLDDTLVKTWQVKWAHHKAVAKRFYNLNLTDEVLAEHWGKPFDQMIGCLYQNADTIDNMRTANRSIEAEFLKSELQPGAFELVAALKDAGVKLGVLTSTNRDFALQDLQRIGFNVKDFFAIQGADATKLHKPDPHVFEPVFSELRLHTIEPSEAVYVGDAIIDFEAARDAGMGFIAVVGGRSTLEDFQNAGAKNITSALPELERLLLPRLEQVGA